MYTCTTSSPATFPVLVTVTCKVAWLQGVMDVVAICSKIVTIIN